MRHLILRSSLFLCKVLENLAIVAIASFFDRKKFMVQSSLTSTLSFRIAISTTQFSYTRYKAICLTTIYIHLS